MEYGKIIDSPKNLFTKHCWIVLLLLILLFESCRVIKNKPLKKDQSIISTNTDTTTTIKHIQGTLIHLFDNGQVLKTMTTLDYYDSAFDEIICMLDGKKPLDFKNAVFITENAFFNNQMDYNEYNYVINGLKDLCLKWMKSNHLVNYPYSDSIKLHKNSAIFSVMKDTIYLVDGIPFYEPYKYDFESSVQNDWSAQFVTRLLVSGLGNCHSLPYLYKILANELNTEAYLSMAPNHIYIKHRSKKWGWYNTELTSSEFPSDAWVKASGYITMDAIRSGIYMDTLSQHESVALCVYDLAKNYQVQTNNYSDGFILKCCDLALKYNPELINAIILKAETLKKNYESLKKSGNENEAKAIFNEMQEIYMNGLKLGYREMSAEMYRAWLNSAKEGNEKFVNQEINRTFQKK